MEDTCLLLLMPSAEEVCERATPTVAMSSTASSQARHVRPPALPSSQISAQWQTALLRARGPRKPGRQRCCARDWGVVKEALARPRPSTRLHFHRPLGLRSEEHTSELQSLMRISYAVFCLKKK